MDVGAQVRNSLRWLAAARFSAQIINWAVTIVVIRLLDPSDYGLMAMAMVVVGFMTLLHEMGLGASLVQRHEIRRDEIEKVLGAVLAVSALLYLALFGLAPAMAAFMDAPALVEVTRVLGLTVLVSALSVIPISLLNRNMDFRRRSIVDFSAMTASSAVTLGLALLDHGVWSLVFGTLTAAAVKTVMSNAMVATWYRPRLSPRGIAAHLSFGGWVSLSRIIWYFYTQADVIILGKLLGKELLGFYSVAMHLATLPMTKIQGILNEVGFAAYSRVQTDRPLYDAHFRHANKLVGTVAFPVFWGIASVSPEIVGVFLGEKWAASVLPLQILSLVVPLRMLSNLTSPALLGLGRADITVINVVAATCIMIPAFVIGARYELVGVSMAWALAYPLVFLVVLRTALPAIGTRFRDYWASIGGVLAAAGAMYAAIWALREWHPPEPATQGLFLVAYIGVGAAVYTAVLAALDRDALTDIRRTVRR